jgi:hypothetical protein
VSTEVHADLEQKVFVVHSVAETVDTLDLARVAALSKSWPPGTLIIRCHEIDSSTANTSYQMLWMYPCCGSPHSPGYVEGGSFTAAFIGVNQAFPVGSGLLRNFQCR